MYVRSIVYLHPYLVIMRIDYMAVPIVCFPILFFYKMIYVEQNIDF